MLRDLGRLERTNPAVRDGTVGLSPAREWSHKSLDGGLTGRRKYSVMIAHCNRTQRMLWRNSLFERFFASQCLQIQVLLHQSISSFTDSHKGMTQQNDNQAPKSTRFALKLRRR